LVFERLILNEGVLEVKYTKAFQIPHDAVLAINGTKMEKTEEKTDQIFVPLKKPVVTGQSGDFSVPRPIWLPLVNAFKNREIEFGFSLTNIQTVFDAFRLQPIAV